MLIWVNKREKCVGGKYSMIALTTNTEITSPVFSEWMQIKAWKWTMICRVEGDDKYKWWWRMLKHEKFHEFNKTRALRDIKQLNLELTSTLIPAHVYSLNQV